MPQKPYYGGFQVTEEDKVLGRAISTQKGDLLSVLAKSKARKARRQANVRFIARVSGKPVRSIIKTGDLKANIVRLLGLLDRKINGPLCRLGPECPQYPKVGPHNGECAYHIVPAGRGGKSRFLPLNVIWACCAANCGEKWHRSLYFQKHIRVFGADRMARIEEAANITADYSRAELFELREQIKARLEAPCQP